MAADKITSASFVNLCLLLMKELRMTETALEEFVRKVCCCKEGLQSLVSVEYWELVNADQFSLEKIRGPFKPDTIKGVNIRPEKLDLNQLAPESEEPCWGLGMIQDHDNVVEVSDILQRTRQKRKRTEASTSRVKSPRVSVERAPPPANKGKGKAVIEVESSEEN